MSSLQRYVLNPYEKWRLFGEWPWQLTWHLCIVALATYQVAVNTELHGVTERSMGMHFANVFYPDNYARYNGDSAVHPWPHYYIFTWEDLQDDLALAKQRYFALPDIGLAPARVAQEASSNNESLIIEGRHSSSNGVYFPVLQLKQFVQSSSSLLDAEASFDAHSFRVNTYSLRSKHSDMQALFLQQANGSHNAFMASLYGMTLTLPVQVWTPSSFWVAWTFSQCTQWLVHIKYHFHNKGQIEVLPGYHLQGACSGKWMDSTQWQPRTQRNAPQDDGPANTPVLLPVRHKGLLRTQSSPKKAPLGGVTAKGRPFQLPDAEQAAMQAYLTVLVALAVGIGIAHEVTVVSECCSAAALVRQLSRRALVGQSTAPHRRQRVLVENMASAEAVAGVDGRAGELQDAVIAAHSTHTSRWSLSHCVHQCALIRGWHVAASAGNLCNMAYFVLLAVEFKVDSVVKHVSVEAEDVFDSPVHTVAPRLLLGAGAALLWLSLLQYLEHFPKYYSFILTLKRAMPRLTRVRTYSYKRRPRACTCCVFAVPCQRCAPVHWLGAIWAHHVWLVRPTLGQSKHDIHYFVCVCEWGCYAGDLLAHTHLGEQLHDSRVADIPVHLRVPVHVCCAERVCGYQRRSILCVTSVCCDRCE